MRVSVVRTYDKSKFSEELEKYYTEFSVDHIDTHTEVCKMRQEDVVQYIAIIFYRIKTADKVLATCPEGNVSIDVLKLPFYIETKIRRYNYNWEENRYSPKKIDTVNDLIEIINNGVFARTRNIGAKTINDTKVKIIEFLEGK